MISSIQSTIGFPLNFDWKLKDFLYHLSEIGNFFSKNHYKQKVSIQIQSRIPVNLNEIERLPLNSESKVSFKMFEWKLKAFLQKSIKISFIYTSVKWKDFLSIFNDIKKISFEIELRFPSQSDQS